MTRFWDAWGPSWSTGWAHYLQEHPPPLAPAKNPTSPAQHILFSGSLVSGSQAAAHAFVVLAGDGAPTVTGGFARWRVIGRPQRVGVTVLDGYDPMSMDVPIMFDAVSSYARTTAADVEGDIKVLEWMGGRGLLFGADNGVGHPGVGDSPLVQVFSADGHGNQVPLIPAAYQTSNLYWVVSAISYDPSPERDRTGKRVRQKATVSLTEYVGGPFATGPDSPAARNRAKRGLAGQYVTFHTTDAVNTIRLVSGRIAHNYSHQAMVTILKANKANPRIGTSLDKKLPRHTTVRIPRAVVKQLA